MKKLTFTLLFFILMLAGGGAWANTYYVATTGSDSNPGTMTSPFASIEKGASVLKSGDILYIRGGTYRTTHAASNFAHCIIQNLSGSAASPILISNYTGEQVIFNMDNITPSGATPVAMYINNCSYLTIRGITSTKMTGGPGVYTYAWQMYNSNHVTFDACVASYCCEGFNMGGGSDILYLNCDAHHVQNPPAYGGSNGFSCTAQSASVTNITYRGCRAWWCSDDGFDTYGSEGTYTYENCWSFWNGYIPGTFSTAGDGQGFKLGPTSSAQASSLRRIVRNCVAFQNRSRGFDQNSGQCQMQLYNNTAYANGEVGFGFNTSATTKTFKNNISYSDAAGTTLVDGGWVQSNNSWNGLAPIKTSDFLSLSNSGVDGSRQADGSLPNLNFLHLASNSFLIDAGTNVGLSFAGSAPDLGAFQSGTSVAPVNQPPVAKAGSTQAIILPISVATLNGSSSTDPDGTITSYSWTKVSGPALAIMLTPNLAITTVTTLVKGVYEFELKVTDNQGATAKDTVTISVDQASNKLPIANAGADKTITLPTNNVTITGNGTDTDGSIAIYQWNKISGPAEFAIASPNNAQTVIGNLVEGVYKFEFIVTDNAGGTGKDTVTVTVNPATNQAPIAHAAIDITITLPIDSTTLSGNATDVDGTIASYQWSKVSGPTSFAIASPAQLQTPLNGLVQGVYQFELKVTDNTGATGKDTIIVTVNAVEPSAGQIPVANAGTDITITLPTNTVTLSGSGIDSAAAIAAYRWTKIAGPAVFVITSRNQAQTTITSLTQGVYQFELGVTNSLGVVAKDTVSVTVNAAPNKAPVANAGLDNNLTLPTNSTTLKGTGIDVDGSIVSYQWNKIAGPSQFTIVSPAQAQTVINGLVQGTYQFELTITDNKGATAKDIVIVSVGAAVNKAPVANAGTNKTITLPTNSVVLSGSGTDADGTVAGYQWSKASGPSQFTMTVANQAQATISNLVQGVYQFELKVTDNNGAIGTATVTVTVNAAVVTNALPIANAGADKTISLPANSVTLQGSGADPGNTIVAYAWNKVEGPNHFTIVQSNQAQTTVNNLAEGIYKFILTVTNSKGAVGKDTVEVAVLNPNAKVSSVSLFPNPAATTLNIKMEPTLTTELTTINIYDVRGMLVRREQVTRGLQTMTRQIDISKYTNGMYVVEVGTEMKREMIKFIKQ